jgi:hypothetical protein
MKAEEFKKLIKEVKEDLKGKTIRITTKNRMAPYYTLKEFGEELLVQESYGKSFSVCQIWTNEGIEEVENFQEFVKKLKAGIVNALEIIAYYPIQNECDYIRSFGSLD